MKKLATLLVATAMTLVINSPAKAQLINGDIAVGAYPAGGFTASSVTLSPANFVQSGSGDLNLNFGSTVLAYSTTVSGLSSSPTAESIPDFFEFSGDSAGFGASGTTPNYRFVFELTSITESYNATNPNITSFSGTGALTDTTGILSPTTATFTLGYSGSNNYSFSLGTTGTAAVTPEPSTWALMFLGLSALAFVAHRKRTA